MDAQSITSLLQEAAGRLAAADAAGAEAVLVTAGASCRETGRYWLLLGAARHRLGRPEAALAAFEHAALLDPAHPQPWHAVTALRVELQRPLAGLQSCNEALRLAPDDPATLINAAHLLGELGHVEAALHAYDKVLAGCPDHHEAWFGRGTLLARMQQVAPAVASLRKALSLQPESVECRFNLAETLLAAGEHAAALESYLSVLQLRPTHFAARMGQGIVLAAMGRLREADAIIVQARAEDAAAFARFRSPLFADARPGEQRVELDARRIFAALGSLRIQHCDWSQWDSYVGRIGDLVWNREGFAQPMEDPGLPFLAHGLPLDLATYSRLASQVSARIERRAPAILRRKNRLTRDRLRIAYLSADFRRHPGGYLMRRMFDLHDRSRFEIYAYSLTPDDGSDIRREIAASSDVFRDFSLLDNASAAQCIAADDIDILVTRGYTMYARSEIVAARPARLNVSYLGFPNTLGAKFVDYALVDQVVCPPEQRPYWTEKLVFLPGTYYIYDDKLEIGAPVSRAEAGLPDDAVVFCSFNQAWKIDPATFDLWMRVLRRVPDAVLWLLVEDELARHNLRQEALRRGIDSSRILFAGRCDYKAHLARQRCADLFLDNLVCNAHTTAVDALWAGLPLMTCPGEDMPSRVAASVLLAAGLPELVAYDRQAYEELAVRLGTHAGELATITAKLRQGIPSAPLFDTRQRVREIEAAYGGMWERLAQGLPPDSFSVLPPAGR